jgi:hypothetical protein
MKYYFLIAIFFVVLSFNLLSSDTNNKDLGFTQPKELNLKSQIEEYNSHEASAKNDLSKLSKEFNSIDQLETEISKFSNYKFDEFSSDQLNTYNHLVFLRAQLIKKQIFEKAVRNGYNL